MSKLTIVQFKKPWRGYGPKEKAGFSAAQAEALVEGGFATFIAGKSPAAPSKAAGASKGGQAKDAEKQAEQQPKEPPATGDQEPADDDRKP